VSEDTWARHTEQWRDPREVVTGWEDASGGEAELLRHRVRGPFWDLLDELGVTLIVGREYEHLLVSLAPGSQVGHLRIPHPSGIAVDEARGRIHLAATRNPNQLVELAPLEAEGRPLVPIRGRFLPGSLYLHDLAFVGGVLHGNAVGQNAVVRLSYDEPAWERVWWPRGVEDFSVNHLQLNSIAAGPDLASSYFSASAAAPGRRRPGHRDWPVDGRGVIFSGASREPCAHGLTRPHSARLHRGELWVDNSGYGEVGRIGDGRFEPVARLPGWTRGLAFCGDVAFVGTSRVIPRFRRYAPGLDLDRSVCGVQAVDLRTGAIVASLTWPQGNQVFAVEAVPSSYSLGFPFRAGRRRQGAQIRALFSSLSVTPEESLR
jgi:uncharacterized protein (TIGR03032 family)